MRCTFSMQYFLESYVYFTEWVHLDEVLCEKWMRMDVYLCNACTCSRRNERVSLACAFPAAQLESCHSKAVAVSAGSGDHRASPAFFFFVTKSRTKKKH